MEDALRGKDCVKIDGGTFDIDAGGDGIKSNNDEDATRGFVSVTGGTFDIVAGDDGVQAATLVRMAGGELTVEAADDALHSDVEALIAGTARCRNNGGRRRGACGNRAHGGRRHGERGGVLTRSFREAEKVVINGGESHIVASDDGINAATADATASDDAAGASATGSTAPTGDLPAGDAAQGAGVSTGEPPSGDLPQGEAPGDLPQGEAPGDLPQGGGMRGGPMAESPNESMQNGGYAPKPAWRKAAGACPIPTVS